MSQHHHLLILFALMQTVHAASSPLCTINKIEFRRFAFHPNCSQSLTLNTRDSFTCIFAAANSPTPSAVVIPRVGDSCHVMTALCPRYQLTNHSTVLVPTALTTFEHLVMSVKSGCGHKSWDVMTGVVQEVNSDYVLQTAHLDAATFPDAFRSNLLNSMQRLIAALTYKQFILQLYKNSHVVVKLVFDVGSSSDSVTSLNWFSKSRLIESWPVTSLPSMTANYFSIAGHLINNALTAERRFFISLSYQGCNQDRAFMTVLDIATESCPMYQFTQPVPRIVYSSDVTQPMVSSIQDADRLVVLLR